MDNSKQKDQAEILHSLSPRPRDDLLPYAHQIIAGIQDPRVYNIGILGAYCVGKTSIVETLLAHLARPKDKKIGHFCSCPCRDKIKVKRITLTNFDENSANSDDAETEDKTNRLQMAIIEQLHYGESVWDLKWSNFSRLTPRRSTLFAWTIVATIATVALKIGSNFATWPDLKNTLSCLFLVAFAIASVLVAISSVLLFASIRGKISINKVEAKSVSLSFNKNGEGFDKFFDEITYYLSVTEYNAILFEDLDRFNEKTIYYDLRRLNQMINNASWPKKRKITFIYALKDSLISNASDRAKFFDLPVYVTPFMSAGNAEGYIIEQFGHFGVKIENKKLLAILAKRLNDYRQISALANMVANNLAVIKNGALDWIQDDKIIAMSLIRHCFPKEYEDLQLGKGEVDKLFRDCNDARTRKIDELNRVINEMPESPGDVFEQKSAEVWQRIVESIPSYLRGSEVHAEHLSGARIFEKDIHNESFWREVKKDGEIRIYQQGTAKTFKVDALTRDDRELQNAIKYTGVNLAAKKKELEEVRSKSVWDFMDGFGNEDTLKGCIWDLKNANAIDDSYRSYIAPYIGGNISLRALNYIENNIKGGNVREDEEFSTQEWDDVIEAVIKMDALDSPGLLNYSFIDYLIGGGVSGLRMSDFIDRQKKHRQELLKCYYGYLQRYLIRGGKITNMYDFTDGLVAAFSSEMLDLVCEKDMLKSKTEFAIALRIVEVVADARVVVGDSAKDYLRSNLKRMCVPKTVDLYIDNGILAKIVDEINDSGCKNRMVLAGCFELNGENAKYLRTAPIEKMLKSCTNLDAIKAVLKATDLNREVLSRMLVFYALPDNRDQFMPIAGDLALAVKRIGIRVDLNTMVVISEYVDDSIATQLVVSQLRFLGKDNLLEVIDKVKIGKEFKKISESGYGTWITIATKDEEKIANRLAKDGIVGPVREIKGRKKVRVLWR